MLFSHLTTINTYHNDYKINPKRPSTFSKWPILPIDKVSIFLQSITIQNTLIAPPVHRPTTLGTTGDRLCCRWAEGMPEAGQPRRTRDRSGLCVLSRSKTRWSGVGIGSQRIIISHTCHAGHQWTFYKIMMIWDVINKWSRRICMRRYYIDEFKCLGRPVWPMALAFRVLSSWWQVFGLHLYCRFLSLTECVMLNEVNTDLFTNSFG